MSRIFAAAFAFLVLTATGATAAERTVTLAVENMYCASCPYIVKQTLAAVPGVRDVQVSYETKTAVVIFDDKMTGPDALTEATSGMGYPSSVLQQGG